MTVRMVYSDIREPSRELSLGQNITRAEFAVLQKNGHFTHLSFSQLDANRDQKINWDDFPANVPSKPASGTSAPSTPAPVTNSRNVNIAASDVKTTGGVNTGNGLLTQRSIADKGDLEIVVLGASGSKNGTGYMNASAMESQGFEKRGVKGDGDKKVEVWARVNNGQSTVKIPGDAKDVGFTIHTIDSRYNLSPDNLVTSGSSGKLSKGERAVFDSSFRPTNGFTIHEVFMDDPGRITDAGQGKLKHSTSGFGDGDSHSSIIFPGGYDGSNYSVINDAPQGRQSIEMLITFEK